MYEVLLTLSTSAFISAIPLGLVGATTTGAGRAGLIIFVSGALLLLFASGRILHWA